MRITIVSYIYPYPKRGFNPGIERVVQETARELVSQGHEVHVITTYRNGGVRRNECDNGVTIHRIPDTRSYLGSVGSVFSIDNVSINVVLRKHMKLLNKSDVVHTFTPIVWKFFSTPLVSHYHHWDEPNTLKEHLYLPTSQQLWLQCYRISNRVIAVSEYSRNELAKKGIEKNKIRVVPNGVDVGRFYPGKSQVELPDWEHTLLYVGPLVERKGLSYLIEAMVDIVGEYPDSGLVIVGSGSDRPLRKLVNKYGLSSNVRFEGFVEDRDLPDYYRAADIFVLPSLLEGFGMVLIEAMASGLPVISTDTTAIPEVVGDAGCLVSPKSSTQIAGAVSDSISKNKLDSMSKNSLYRARTKFTWESSTNQLLDEYTDLVKS